jgi:hypothetical protein
MRSRSIVAATLLTVAGLLSACASAPSGGSLSDYVGVGYTNVTTTCGGGFQVYRQPVNGRVLVAAYAVSNMRQSFCQSWRGEPPAPSLTGARYEEAVREYISKTPTLKGCTVVSGIEITQLHSEFVVSCPAAPAAPVIKAKG